MRVSKILVSNLIALFTHLVSLLRIEGNCRLLLVTMYVRGPVTGQSNAYNWFVKLRPS
jgi:hypothetical protein